VKLIDCPSAWKGLENHIESFLDENKIPRDNCLEFGVEHGYSIAAMSNWFRVCTGVDTFKGDPMSGFKEDHLKQTRENLKDFDNIYLTRMDFREFIKRPGDGRWNLIHIDISHDYESTYECGAWAVDHSDCTIFHDTTTFQAVRAACQDIAHEKGLEFKILTPDHNGLGFILNKIKSET